MGKEKFLLKDLPLWQVLNILSVNVKKTDWSLLGQSVSGLHSNNDKSLHSAFLRPLADYNFHKRDDDESALFMNDDAQLCSMVFCK